MNARSSVVRLSNNSSGFVDISDRFVLISTMSDFACSVEGGFVLLVNAAAEGLGAFDDEAPIVST
jgi:hypothetical protein